MSSALKPYFVTVPLFGLVTFSIKAKSKQDAKERIVSDDTNLKIEIKHPDITEFDFSDIGIAIDKATLEEG